MLMKITSMLISYFAGRSAGGPGHPGLFAQLSMQSLRKVAILLSMAMVGFLLALSGLFTVLLDLVLTTHQSGSIAVSPATAVGLGLVVLSAVTFFVTFRSGSWKPAEVDVPKVPPQPQGHPHSALSDALAHLVQDFVVERRESRERHEAERLREQSEDLVATPDEDLVSPTPSSSNFRHTA